ncbi:MAG: stalk domain-containing protein [Vulcanimicrobiaceae bacterium]
MIGTILVSVLVDGKLVASSRSAELAAGVVRAPLDPFVRRIVDRITSDGRTITLEGGDATVRVVVGSRLLEANGASRQLPFAPFLRRGEPVVPLAALARALGVVAAYDGVTRTLVLQTAPRPLATMTPYQFWTPPTAPAPTFTPTSVPTPRPTVSGIPQPRRTPIVIDPEHPPN